MQRGNRWSLSAPAFLAVSVLVLALLGWVVVGALTREEEKTFESEADLLAAIGADSDDLGASARSGSGGHTGQDTDMAGDGSDGTGPSSAELGSAESGLTEPGHPEVEVEGSESGAAQLVVYVSGRVKKPGVVTLAPGSRVVEALELAGGPTEDAQLDGTNLARLLVDGEQVHVPGPEEKVGAPGSDSAIGSGAPSAVVGTGGQTGTQQTGQPCIDINSASVAELEALPGIGPALSQRIVEYREANGNYQQNADLRSVTGIGAKIYAGLEADLCQ